MMSKLERVKKHCKERNDFERAEEENRKIVRVIKNVGRGGCHAPYFIVANKW